MNCLTVATSPSSPAPVPRTWVLLCDVRLDQPLPLVRDRELPLLADDRVLTLAPDLRGERVGERVRVLGGARLIDPDAAAAGDSLLDRERCDPGRVRLRKSRLDCRRVVGVDGDRAHVLRDQRLDGAELRRVVCGQDGEVIAERRRRGLSALLHLVAEPAAPPHEPDRVLRSTAGPGGEHARCDDCEGEL